MSPEAARSFGRTVGQSARAAALLAFLGGAAVVGLGRYLTAPRGPLGEAYAATGLPEWFVPGIGGLCVAGVAFAGFMRSVREATQFRVTPVGLEVTGALGAFTVTWDNLEAAEVTDTRALGLRLQSREALLTTHRGTALQREWLATMEPIGGWDLLYPAADLGYPAETVRGWIAAHIQEA